MTNKFGSVRKFDCLKAKPVFFCLEIEKADRFCALNTIADLFKFIDTLRNF